MPRGETSIPNEQRRYARTCARTHTKRTGARERERERDRQIEDQHRQQQRKDLGGVYVPRIDLPLISKIS